VLLDGAHNAAGAATLARYLADEVRRPVKLVAGLSGQRPPNEVLAPLAGLIRAVYAAPVTKMVTVPPGAIVEWAQQCGLPARAFATPAEAFAAASAERQNNDVVVVAGSLYLVAAVRGLLRADAAWLLSDERESR
jgi:dihydrofolate synthase/folylpolyglutamate synthase